VHIHFAAQSCVLLYWQRYCTALEQWALAKFCGVQQRAPPILGRAAITLGIGPHSSLWLCNRAGHIYIFILSFVLLLLFSLPNLSGRRLDVCHTSKHCVASANLGCRSETCYMLLAGNAGRKKIAKKSPSAHHRTILSCYIFTTKTRIDNRKKLLSSDTSCTCSDNIVNFGPLAAEIDPVVWGTPANFNGFCVLAALKPNSITLAGSELVGSWFELKFGTYGTVDERS